MITKVYFPRLIAPLAPVLSALVDFVCAFSVLWVMIGIYHFATDFTFVPTWRLLLLPAFILLALLTALGLSMWLSALNALYRDVKYIVPFLTQLLMFASPVVYSTSSIMKRDVPEWAKTLYALNPLVGVLEGFRWALFGTNDLSLPTRRSFEQRWCSCCSSAGCTTSGEWSACSRTWPEAPSSTA